ncbi:MAG: hypothetical protein WD648_14780 [Planctomycetaceae bacterium]
MPNSISTGAKGNGNSKNSSTKDGVCRQVDQVAQRFGQANHQAEEVEQGSQKHEPQVGKNLSQVVISSHRA